VSETCERCAGWKRLSEDDCWWHDDPDWAPSWPDWRHYGECQKTLNRFRHRGPNDQPPVKDHPAYGMDGEGYYAVLRTRCDFGCTMFEVSDD